MTRKRIISSMIFMLMLMMLMHVHALADEYTMKRTKNVFTFTVPEEENLEEPRTDHLKFTVSTPGLLTVTAQEVDGWSITHVCLLNSSKQNLGASWERICIGSEQIYYGLGPGTYYFEIEDPYYNAYTVTARFDKFPNDGSSTQSGAMFIPRNQAKAGVMSPGENYKVVDWYKINVPSCERIRINYDIRGDGDFRLVFTDKILNYAKIQTLTSDNYKLIDLGNNSTRETSYVDFNPHIFDGRTKPGVRYIGIARNEEGANAQYYVRWNTLTVPGSPELKVPGAMTKYCGSAAFKLGASAKSGRLTYTSSNKAVATIDSTGKVTVKAPGTTTITVTSPAIGKYKKATAKVKLTVAMKKTVLSSVSSPAKKQLRIAWQKNTSGQGYEILLSNDKNFTHGQKFLIKSNAITYHTYTGTPSKTWYVKIRAYRKVGSKTYYGAWSAVKSVKVK